MTKLINNKYGIIPDGNIYFKGASQVTKSIIKGVFSSEETQKLKGFTENNPWHDKENVYLHILHVFANIQILLTFEFVDDAEIRNDYKKYFKLVPSGCELSRAELLLIACSLHDLGKGAIRPKNDDLAPGKTYLLTLDDGTTKGKGHELASAFLSKTLLSKTGLSTADRDYIYNLIENHDFYNFKYCEDNLNYVPERDAEILRKSNPYNLELILHIIADEYGAEITKKLRSYLLGEVVAKNNILLK